jgi:hypothetical protein
METIEMSDLQKEFAPAPSKYEVCYHWFKDKKRQNRVDCRIVVSATSNADAKDKWVEHMHEVSKGVEAFLDDVREMRVC